MKWPLMPRQTPISRAPRGTWKPTWDSLGPYSACDQIWSAGVSPRMAPKTGKIHFFSGLWPILGLKTAKYFRCAPPRRGHQGRKRKKIAPFSTKIHFLKRQRKTNFSTYFSIFLGVQKFFGLKTAKSFQCGKQKKNRPVFDENTFSETATKKKSNFFFDFWGSKFFVGWGPEFLQVPRPLQKPVNRDFVEKLG